MTTARLKRLQRLESRRPSEAPWRDPGPAAVALFRWHLDNYAAVEAGRACLVPSEPQPESSWSDAKRRVTAETDRIAARLAQEAR